MRCPEWWACLQCTPRRRKLGARRWDLGAWWKNSRPRGRERPAQQHTVKRLNRWWVEQQLKPFLPARGHSSPPVPPAAPAQGRAEGAKGEPGGGASCSRTPGAGKGQGRPGDVISGLGIFYISGVQGRSCQYYCRTPAGRAMARGQTDGAADARPPRRGAPARRRSSSLSPGAARRVPKAAAAPRPWLAMRSCAVLAFLLCAGQGERSGGSAERVPGVGAPGLLCPRVPWARRAFSTADSATFFWPALWPPPGPAGHPDRTPGRMGRGPHP